MRIKVINPVIVTSVDWGPLMKTGYAHAHDTDTELDYVFLDKGIESTEQHFWEEIEMTYLISELEATDQAAYDGVIVFCATDPGVISAKEWLDIPVVGLLETSVALARLVGRRFSWISPLSRGNGLVYDRMALTGASSHLASIRALEVPLTDLHGDGKLLERTLAEGRAAVEEDGADSLIIGCTGMFGLAENVQQELGVPVIDAGAAGIRMIEMLVKMGLAPSEIAYPTPRAEMRRRL